MKRKLSQWVEIIATPRAIAIITVLIMLVILLVLNFQEIPK